MTHFSASLSAYPEALRREQLEQVVIDAPRLSGLPGLPDRFSPYALAGWAERHGLEVYYVDNCWVRVPVNADQLRTFANEMLDADGAAQVGKLISGSETYLLSAEEY